MFLQFCLFFSISVSLFCQFSRFNWCILVLFSFHVVLAKYWRKRSPGEWKSLLGFFFITEAFAAISLLTANNKWWSLWRCLVRKKKLSKFWVHRGLGALCGSYANDACIYAELEICKNHNPSHRRHALGGPVSAAIILWNLSRSLSFT